jgi:uncharacterized protein with FMN-binding domain
MRRALAALAVTALAVVLLARYETHPPKELNPESALRGAGGPAIAREGASRPATAREAPPPARSGVAPGAPGTRSATGPTMMTPFSVIQVRATVRGRRLVGVETLLLTGSDAHTNALNARAEPILRAEALRAGSADVDVVSGATYTSEHWRDSLGAAIAAARRRHGA